MKTSKEVRSDFIEFFKARDHQFVRSSSVAPNDDPTLLFTNAGMNQFKPIFIGQDDPTFLRAVNTQKCIRVSGKHNDLEEVGVDDYHHTFFEMLGNWSFGDYYKEQAIKWAWELLTEVWKIDKNRLWVTIYKDDDEAGEIWGKVTDIDHDRILKFGNKDNFWEMGDTGPCGPCSEIHYYTGDIKKQDASGVNVEAEYRELWNLVFIQFNRDQSGTLHDLPAKHVDTGAGFERLAAVLNGETSNYNTDIFIPILKKIEELTGEKYSEETGIPHRVIADHLRMLSFSIADGALPGNEGRGYVLRRVLRRAARFGRSLNMHEPFIYKCVTVLVDEMGEAFPELVDRKKHIEKVIKAEEISFSDTLDRGIEIFEKFTSDLNSGDEIRGTHAFKLYDTYGFPLDLTELMAREKNLSVDVKGFEKSMEEQRQRARDAGSFNHTFDDGDWHDISSGDSNKFVGYTEDESISKIRKYRLDGNDIELVLDRTPFYAEQGGQVGDTGTISKDDLHIEITDTRKNGDDISHFGKIKSGDIQGISEVMARIDTSRRNRIRLNHTATHLLQKALKMVVGDHVHQAGSHVGPDRLRFDLTHFERLDYTEISKIEDIVNSAIRDNTSLDIQLMSFDKAQNEGAVALFGEKYGDEVRVVDVPGFSKELCGGTHVERTGDIGAFKIITESALASGVRRIEAITGDAVIDVIHKQESLINNIKDLLKTSAVQIPEKIGSLLNEKKQMGKELSEFRKGSQKNQVEELINQSQMVNNVKIIVESLDEVGDLKEMGDAFRSAFKISGVVLIVSVINGKPMAMCAVTDDLIKIVNAGNIVREVGKIMGGGGGGKPHLATAGGRDITKIDEAVKVGKNLIISLLESKAD